MWVMKMKILTKLWFGVLITVILVFLVVPTNVVAEKGTVEVYIDPETVQIGSLSEGDIIEYSWETDSSATYVTFYYILNGDTNEKYTLKRNFRSWADSFEVDVDGNYYFVFEKGASQSTVYGHVYVNYEYNIIKEEEDSPGFELFGVAMAIGLCTMVLGWKRRHGR